MAGVEDVCTRLTLADKKTVAVIGAGWAGCAAAVQLTQLGHKVALFEASRTLGGRARRVEIEDKIIDNGQHILLGAYTECLRMMQLVGIDLKQALLRLPLQMRYPPHSGGMDFIAPRLPAPLHVLIALWRATGLTISDKLALAQFSTTARWMGWHLHTDCSVSELLERFNQTEHLIRLMWRPLCIAALNTPPERASAQVFLNVLRDSLGARRAASDMLIPRVDLTALFPQHAASFIAGNGGMVQTGTNVTEISGTPSAWQLSVRDTHGIRQLDERFDNIVIATQYSHAQALLQALLQPASAQQDIPPAADFSYEPITTCYLQYAPGVKLDQPFFALLDDAARNEWGQFVFDRGQLDTQHAGLLAVVISASGDAIALEQQALIASVTTQLARVLQQPVLNQPLWSKIISEKRATFACTPALYRPANQSGHDGILLAGDYTAGAYPATLEAAVQSGLQAAHLIAGQAEKH
jgi:hydroxysqualene dehydroxylase